MIDAVNFWKCETGHFKLVLSKQCKQVCTYLLQYKYIYIHSFKIYTWGTDNWIFLDLLFKAASFDFKVIDAGYIYTWLLLYTVVFKNHYSSTSVISLFTTLLKLNKRYFSIKQKTTKKKDTLKNMLFL